MRFMKSVYKNLSKIGLAGLVLLAVVSILFGSIHSFAQSSPTTSSGPAQKPLLQDIKIYNGDDDSSDPAKLGGFMVRAALAGKLDTVATRTDPVFGLAVPAHVPGVPDGVLDPRATWKDPAAYDAQAAKLLALFQKNFEQFAPLK